MLLYSNLRVNDCTVAEEGSSVSFQFLFCSGLFFSFSIFSESLHFKIEKMTTSSAA